MRGEGAADIPNANADYFKTEATVYSNSKEFLSLPGDVVVFNRTFGGGYGHVGIVVSADLNNIVVIEQNYLGGGWTSGPAQGGTGWEKATIRTHPYSFPQWFIRPKYKTDEASKTKVIESKKETPKTTTKKPIQLNYIKDIVRGYDLPKRGYNPKGIV